MTVFVWGHGGATHGLLAGVFLAKGQHPVIFTLCEGQTHPDCRQVDRTKAEQDGVVCCFVWVRTAAFLLTFQVSPSGLNPAESTAEVIPQLTWRLGVATFRCSPFQTPCDSLLCTLRLSKSAEALCSRSHRSTQSLACGKKLRCRGTGQDGVPLVDLGQKSHWLLLPTSETLLCVGSDQVRGSWHSSSGLAKDVDFGTAQSTHKYILST